ncbi:hypothetical protein GF326_07400 [Candidatus Bathyarchaeota archaeon]|nr:hypothetical protein [Candidatus Bathyarchaeota archaeon]
MERKGVSTYISVLLLIVVVIAGGIMIYGYTMGWFGRLGGEGEMGTLSLDSAKAYANNTIIVYIRNVGNSPVTIDSVYIDNTPASDVTVEQNPIPTNTAKKVSATGGFTITSGTTYEVKIVATDNTQIAFSVKAE